MIVVSINGEERRLPAQTTLAEVLRDAGAPSGGRGYAIAIDGAVVPRSRWSQTPLHAGARVEIVVAVQGG